MTGQQVQVQGADTLARTLRNFADDLQDLADAGARAGALVARDAAVRARRATGRLASSFTPVADAAGVSIGSPLLYGAVQEYGWPGHGITPSYALTGALAARTGAVSDTYAVAVDQALGKVRGA